MAVLGSRDGIHRSTDRSHVASGKFSRPEVGPPPQLGRDRLLNPNHAPQASSRPTWRTPAPAQLTFCLTNGARDRAPTAGPRSRHERGVRRVLWDPATNHGACSRAPIGRAISFDGILLPTESLHGGGGVCGRGGLRRHLENTTISSSRRISRFGRVGAAPRPESPSRPHRLSRCPFSISPPTRTIQHVVMMRVGRDPLPRFRQRRVPLASRGTSRSNAVAPRTQRGAARVYSFPDRDAAALGRGMCHGTSNGLVRR